VDQIGLDSYLRDMENNAWGDGIMLSAAVRLFGQPVIILTPDGREQIVDTGDTDKSDTEHIRLGFINNSHYVSINHLSLIEKGDCDASKTDESEKPEMKSKKPLQTTVEVEPSSEIPAQVPAQFQCIDIGHIIKKSHTQQLNDDDRNAALHRRWTPNINKREDMPFSLHVSAQGKQVRRYLGESFLKEYRWLSVSKEPGLEGAWCVYCSVFQSSESGGGRGSCGGIGGNQKMGALVNTPLSKFRKLSGKDGVLSCHENTQFHKASSLRAVEFQNRYSSTGEQESDVRSVIDKNRRKEVEANREFFVSLADIVMTCAKQDIPLRGHRDDGAISADGNDPPLNDGNWRSLIRLTLRHGNTVLAQHLKTARRNATYTSKTVQNELLQAAGDLIQRRIVTAVNDVMFFSVLADETQDRAKHELLQVTVRYVEQEENGDNWIVKEDPLSVLNLLNAISEQQTCSTVDEGTETVDDAAPYDPAEERVRMIGASIGKSLITAMQQAGLELKNCVGCGFDGAAAMSSERIGAAAVVKSKAPLADYFHCTMHSFNLSASQSSKIVEIRHCFDCIQETVSFFRFSAKRTLCLENVIKHVAPESRRVRLVSVCSTRFIERHTAVLVFSEMMPYVVEALHGMTRWNSTDTRRTALQLLNNILTPQFIVSLVMLESITAVMHPVSCTLQKVGIDIIGAIQQVDNLLAVLRDWRKDAEKKSELFDKSNKIATDFDIPMSCPRAARLSRYRSNIHQDNPCDFYRTNVYIPLLDVIITDISDRFGPHQRQTFALAGLIPAQLGQWTQIRVAVDKYAAFLDTPAVVEGEFSLWAKKWANSDDRMQCKTAVNALNACPSQFFPNINVLLRILSTLPSSTAEPERVFSKVNKTLSAIRSTMTEDRLESCILLQVHRSLTPEPAAVIDRFATTAARRLSFVL